MPKLPVNQLAQFVVRNPFTAAAAVFAPIFAQNEDRGYFRTALITTPVIFAANQFAPQLFNVRGAARDVVQTSNLLKNAEKWTRFEQMNYHDLNVLFKDKAVPGNVIDRAVSNYLVSERRHARDFLKEQKTLTKLFYRKFAIPQDLIARSQGEGESALRAFQRVNEIAEMQEGSRGRMLTNAIQSARRAALTPEEWMSELSPAWEASVRRNLTNEELTATFEQYSNRPEFVKTLRNKLREMKRLSYGGTLQVAEGGPGASNLAKIPIDFEWNDVIEKQLQAQAPEMYDYLEQAKGAGRIVDVTALAEDVVKGKTGRIHSVLIRRREAGNLKELTLPIVDPATGTVRLSGNAIGVADWVIDPSQNAHRIDTWVAKMIAEQPSIPFHEAYPGGPSLESEVSAHAYWHAGDPMDARRMAELAATGEEGAGVFTAQARKLRSFAAKYTKLPIWMNAKGEQVAYSQLTPAEQQVVVRKTLNSNRYVNMSSEAGTYEGRFVLREASWLSPYGAPSAAKQDPIWRSVTKEFQLRTDQMPSEGRLGWRSNAWEALTGSSDLPAAKFTVASLDPQTRTAMIAELKASGRGDLAATLGKMGETGFVMNEAFSEALNVEGISKYNMNEIGVKVGDIVDENTVMGFRDYDRVVAKHLGTVADVAQDESGYVVNVRHQLGMQGAKVDIAGIKGMVPETMGKTNFEELRGAVNEYLGRTGQDAIPSGVNVFAPAEYFANKLEPSHAYLGIGSDLVSRLPEDVSAQYRSRMASELATTWQDGQLVIDASKLQQMKGVTDAQRLQKLSEISEEFFAKASEAIRSAGGYQDPVLTAFVHSGQDVGNWMLKNSLPAMGFTWDHSMVNAPRFASVTHDIATHMALGGNYAGLKALQSRVVTSSGGSAEQSLDFMKYLMAGDFTKEFGNTVPIGEAFPTRFDLTRAENRAGSIFDPSKERFKKNFRLDLGGGQFLPVPGTEAYGAEAKMFEPGKYQTRRWQHTLQAMAFETDAEKKAVLRGKVISQYQEMFGTGKGSVLRPYEQDPMSIAGVFSTIAEEENPFVARISPELAAKVRSKRLRDALLQGDEVFGALHRQPTNQMLYMKFKVDQAMAGTLDVGVAERISRAYIGDQDKDTAYALLFDANIRNEQGKAVIADAGSKLESDAAMEAFEKINNGEQLRRLEEWEGVKGTPEVANRVTDFRMKTLAQRSADFSTQIERRVGTAINRTAGASIGSFSNIVTEINEQMLRNSRILRDPDMASRLNAMFFDIRQAPISARKAPSFSLEQAMIHINQLKKAMLTHGTEEASQKVHGAILNLSKTINPNFMETREAGYLMGQGVEDIRAWAAGRSEMGTLAKQAFTAVADQSRPFSEQYVAKNLSNIFMDVDATLGAVHGGRATAQSVTRLGVIAEGLAEAGRGQAETVTGALGKIFSKHGKTLALGVGVMAALGAVTSKRMAPVASFSRASGNRFRPEEKIGFADSIPGEPIPGSMAPSSPPRRMGVAAPNVKTGVVAPMRSRTDLEVRMRATDTSRAAETSRMLSQIPGSGDTNVTINYRDRTKLRSLRTREKIRDIMNG